MEGKPKKIRDLVIDKKFISILASGPSSMLLGVENLYHIRNSSFVFTMNYAPIQLKGDCNIFSDRKVSEFLQDYYLKNRKDCLLLSKADAFGEHTQKIRNQVDYFFDVKEDEIRGNFTIGTLIQLIQKYWPDKVILVFGLDMKVGPNNEVKWYDKFTDYDKGKRRLLNIKQEMAKIEASTNQLKDFTKNTNIYNCNMQSLFDYYPKMEWREVFSK